MGIKLVKNNGKVDLTAPAVGMVIQGEDGGYYIPSIDEKGNLTWTPTKETMEAIESANIMGPAGAPGKDGKDGAQGKDGAPGKDGLDGKDGQPGRDGVDGKNGIDGKDGKDGNPGVYVGTSAPTDDSLIWINPEGDEIEDFATKEYVDNAIAAINIPDAPGGGITEAEVEAMLAGYITETQLNTKLIEYATEGYVLETMYAQGYQTAAQVNALISAALGEVENGAY